MTQTLRGGCINADNGFLCPLLGGEQIKDHDLGVFTLILGGNRCNIRVCRECYESSDCIVYNKDVRPLLIMFVTKLVFCCRVVMEGCVIPPTMATKENDGSVPQTAQMMF